MSPVEREVHEFPDEDGLPYPHPPSPVKKRHDASRYAHAHAGGAPDAWTAARDDDRGTPAPLWADLEARPHLTSVRVAGVELRIGDPVRLHPRCRADIFDIALSGMVATVESIERDFDDRVHIAVTLGDTLGKGAGIERARGQRYFFGPDEIEPLRRSGGQA